ncbi:polysaccharide deacetylase family protein [Achromobacter insuavis]
MQAIPYGVPLDAAANPWLALDHELRAEGRRAPSAPPVRAVVCVTVHVDGPAVEVGRKQFPGAGIHTAGRYAIRRGVPRHLEILARHAMPATFFACGYDVEHYPDTFRAILAAGHEIAAHGYLHEAWDLGEDEPALLEKTHTLIQRQLGVTPVGWCSPSGRKSHRTLPTLRRLGYCYDASERDRDRPTCRPRATMASSCCPTTRCRWTTIRSISPATAWPPRPATTGSRNSRRCARPRATST